MKKNLRRATACILTLLLCLNLCAGAVFAVDDTDETETPAATDTDDTADLESVGTGSVVVEPEAQTSTDSSAQAPTGEGGAPSDASSSKAEAEAQTPGTESGAAAQDDGAVSDNSGVNGAVTDADSVDGAAAPGTTDQEQPAEEPSAEPDASQQEAPRLSYVVVDTPELSAPAAQEILVGLEDDATPEQAVLTVRNETTGESLSYDATSISAGALLFRIDYTADQAGTYVLESLRYVCDGVETQVSFAEVGIQAGYGVDTAVETDPDGVVVEDSADTQQQAEPNVVFDVTTLDKGGDQVLADSIEDALNNAQVDTGISTMSLPDDGKIVIVLDPGHDATHTGTSGTTNGVKYNEYEYNLKIAQYCQQELQRYSGVQVNLTRYSNACPSNGSDATKCNTWRVNLAEMMGADYFISIHLNSADAKSAHGAEVYYPNQNYRPDLSQQGQELAQDILDQLVALGLYGRGIKIKNSGDNTQYPDESLADYYGVIRRCKEAGITGLIVEHAFMTNSEDFANFLSSDEKLQQLGVADATGIANYLGLSMTKVTGSATAETTDPVSGSFRATFTVNEPDQVSSVLAGVWSEKNGQDDLTWVNATRDGDSWYVDIDTAQHSYDEGEYYVHFYVNDKSGQPAYIVTAVTQVVTLDRSQENMQVAYQPERGSISVEVNAPFTLQDATGVRIAAWSEGNDLDDLQWYQAEQQSDGTWTVEIPLSNHSGTGFYYVHCYKETDDGQTLVLGSGVTVPAITASVDTEITNSTTGAFRVNITDVNVPEAVETIQVAVWSDKDGQDDLTWTTATRKGDSWYADIDTADHNYDAGIYWIHCYVTDTGDQTYLFKMTDQSVEEDLSQEGMEIRYNPAEGTVSVTVNAPMTGAGATGMNIAFWSQENDLDDLCWYEAEKQGNGTWTVEIPLSNHLGTGFYYVHCYKETDEGQTLILGSGITIPAITATVKTSRTDSATGAFRVNITDVNVPDAVETIQVAVWSDKDGQDDLTWTTATREGDSWYADIDTADHNYDSGTYWIHCYVTDTGDQTYIFQMTDRSVTVDQSEDNLSVQWNAANGTFEVSLYSPVYTRNASTIQVAVWSEVNGQDDLVWYEAEDQGDGRWTLTVPLSNHSGTGFYYVHCYKVSNLGAELFMGSGATVEATSATSVIATALKGGSYQLDIQQSLPETVRAVQVAVWSNQNGQDDLMWTAAQKSGNMWSTVVNLADHNNLSDEYFVHVYVTDFGGNTYYTGGIITAMAISNAEIIWNYFQGKGLTAAGTAGLMGNLFAESGLRPENMENYYEKEYGYTDLTYTMAVDLGTYRYGSYDNAKDSFIRDKAGYGLAQWTYWSRKQGLYEFAAARGESISTMSMQLDYLWMELQRDYGSVVTVLKTTNSVQEASDIVLTDFERPKEQSDAVKLLRASYGQKYYDTFA